MKKTLFLLTLTVVFSSLIGCLSVEKKIYSYKLNADGTGEGTIRYINIVSVDDSEKDVSFKDYAELETDYINGTKYEDENPNLKITSKKLYEADGKLCSEVKFTFANFDNIGFFRAANCECCPVMYFVKSSGNQETITESNGKVITDVLDNPFITWEQSAKEFSFTTTLMDESSLQNSRSLLSHWKKYKDKK